MVLGVCRHALRDPAAAEDAFQATFLALARKAGSVRDGSAAGWLFRVAHNAATSHVNRQRRASAQTLVSLEELVHLPDRSVDESAADSRQALERLLGLIQLLKPLDRQVILSYLEGMDAASIGEIVGLSSGNVATKIHRIKNILVRWFQEGGRHGE